jgi:hypothetical protein
MSSFNKVFNEQYSVISFNKAGSIHRTDLKGYQYTVISLKKMKLFVSISIDPTSTKQFTMKEKP